MVWPAASPDACFRHKFRRFLMRKKNRRTDFLLVLFGKPAVWKGGMTGLIGLFLILFSAAVTD